MTLAAFCFLSYFFLMYSGQQRSACLAGTVIFWSATAKPDVVAAQLGSLLLGGRRRWVLVVVGVVGLEPGGRA